MLHRLLFQFALSVTLCAALGCAPAHPEELGHTESGVITTENSQTQIHARRRYLSERTERLRHIQAAFRAMRTPSPGPSRIFFTTSGESGDSFSVGDTRDGYLVHGIPLPLPNLTMRQLPVQYERGLSYGTSELVDLLSGVARTMARKYPHTMLHLGNLGAREGGDIPYSISHNAGRDADIAFYLLDKDGQNIRPDNLVKMNRRLHSPDSVLSFDLEQNTTLVELLLSDPKHRVQFIFLAKHIRSAIHRELLARQASPELLEKFEQTVQNQSAHDDHFHIRVYCSDEDICAGCIDRSIIHPWHEDPLPKREACTARHVNVLQSRKSSPDQIAASLQRLSLIAPETLTPRLIAHHLSSPHTLVRRAAALAAGRPSESIAKVLVEKFRIETDMQVRSDILSALISQNFASVRVLVHDILNGPVPDELLPSLGDFITHFPDASDAEPLLHAAQNASHPRTLLDLLDIVTNRTPCETDDASCLQLATLWFEQKRHLTRQTWLIEGFRDAGFSMDTLTNPAIPTLLDAISAPRPISINAQLTLKKLGHLPQDSLQWPPQDALWHYTRYFKRRAKKYGIDLSDRNDKGQRL